MAPFRCETNAPRWLDSESRATLAMADSQRQQDFNGFTLVELMVAVVLMSVLMVGVWNLLSIYRNVYEKSQDRAERSQLTRSLHQRISDDLKCHVITNPTNHHDDDALGNSRRERDTEANTQDDSTAIDFNAELEATYGRNESPPPSSSGEGLGEGAVDLNREITSGLWLRDAIGLYGTSTGLVLDITNPAEREDVHPPSATVDPQNGINLQQPVPDIWRRVVYVFSDHETSMRMRYPKGLLRCELTAEELLILRTAHSSNLDLMSLIEMASPELIPSDPLGIGASQLSDDNDQTDLLSTETESRGNGADLRTVSKKIRQRIDHVHELQHFQLKYFDGISWFDSWNSRNDGMPVAVEIRFEFRPRQTNDKEEGGLQAAGDRLDPDTRVARPNDARIKPPIPEHSTSQVIPPKEDNRLLVYLCSPPSVDSNDDTLVKTQPLEDGL